MMAWRCWGKSQHPRGHPSIGVLADGYPSPVTPGEVTVRHARAGGVCLFLTPCLVTLCWLKSVFTLWKWANTTNQGLFLSSGESVIEHMPAHDQTCSAPAPRVSRQGQTPVLQSGNWFDNLHSVGCLPSPVSLPLSHFICLPNKLLALNSHLRGNPN